jgi:beta-galactosidase
MIQSTFTIDTPADTWLNMANWHKGVVFINGFNLGRYFKVGPPTTLFVPGPLLNTGINKVWINYMDF